MKRYVLIAGVNGAGKSTLYQTMDSLKGMRRVNIDEIVRGFGDWKNPSDVILAGKVAVKEIRNAFEAGETFNQETTLCGSSIKKNIAIAKSLGYQIELHYVGIESPDIAKKRIAHRVQCGGHGIPDSDVERRYYQSLENLQSIIKDCDMAIIYDNTVSFRRIAEFVNGNLKGLSHNLPFWYQCLKFL